ncbi:UNVERIFIED_CONTAM: panD, partial [Trichonephila clavipes]
MTYVLPGKRGSGEVCMNGGAALHAKVGDTVHILSFINLTKIHTVKVTEANVAYNGSITIDADLLDAAGIVKYEQVYINNAVNGSRIMTY